MKKKKRESKRDVLEDDEREAREKRDGEDDRKQPEE